MRKKSEKNFSTFAIVGDLPPTIPAFYDQVAVSAGYSPEKASKLCYDCREIEVSRDIKDALFASMKEAGYSDLDQGYVWMVYGPKTADDLKGHEVRVFPGFFGEPLGVSA